MRPQSLNIIYEDRHIIVCVKPSGIATQSRSIKNPDMVSLLKNHIAQASSSEDAAGRNSSPRNMSGEPYLAVIHRLDQPVQGVMVFAKTPFAAGELSRELKADGFGKYYRAMVSGKPPRDADTLENYMLKDARSNTSRICGKETAGAKLARLSYRTVPKDQQYFPINQNEQNIRNIPNAPSADAITELDIHLHTGRHHQIRVQLSHIGCPIIGDTKYNPGNTVKSGWQELKLCSYRLEFTHPKTKAPMSFSLI